MNNIQANINNNGNITKREDSNPSELFFSVINSIKIIDTQKDLFHDCISYELLKEVLHFKILKKIKRKIPFLL